VLCLARLDPEDANAFEGSGEFAEIRYVASGYYAGRELGGGGDHECVDCVRGPQLASGEDLAGAAGDRATKPEPRATRRPVHAGVQPEVESTNKIQLCQRAGLVKLGHIAIDGTKVKANASKHKAMS